MTDQISPNFGHYCNNMLLDDDTAFCLLKDVKRWLGELRGKDLPEAFAWSYKRINSVLVMETNERALVPEWLRTAGIGKLPARSVNDEKLEVLKKHEEEKINKLLSKYVALCGKGYHHAAFEDWIQGLDFGFSTCYLVGQIFQKFECSDQSNGGDIRNVV
ncbi:hypothetical protein RIF29_33719 [Crotalaria pallida]|uniref:Uncharacterized protein n=1 Tax=Crotalaria pallida TaxID=3830 RepID=A0AAN9E844_CROPI